MNKNQSEENFWELESSSDKDIEVDEFKWEDSNENDIEKNNGNSEKLLEKTESEKKDLESDSVKLLDECDLESDYQFEGSKEENDFAKSFCENNVEGNDIIHYLDQNDKMELDVTTDVRKENEDNNDQSNDLDITNSLNQNSAEENVFGKYLDQQDNKDVDIATLLGHNNEEANDLVKSSKSNINLSLDNSFINETELDKHHNVLKKDNFNDQKNEYETGLDNKKYQNSNNITLDCQPTNVKIEDKNYPENNKYSEENISMSNLIDQEENNKMVTDSSTEDINFKNKPLIEQNNANIKDQENNKINITNENLKKPEENNKENKLIAEKDLVDSVEKIGANIFETNNKNQSKNTNQIREPGNVYTNKNNIIDEDLTNQPQNDLSSINNSLNNTIKGNTIINEPENLSDDIANSVINEESISINKDLINTKPASNDKNDNDKDLVILEEESDDSNDNNSFLDDQSAEDFMNQFSSEEEDFENILNKNNAEEQNIPESVNFHNQESSKDITFENDMFENKSKVDVNQDLNKVLLIDDSLPNQSAFIKEERNALLEPNEQLFGSLEDDNIFGSRNFTDYIDDDKNAEIKVQSNNILDFLNKDVKNIEELKLNKETLRDDQESIKNCSNDDILLKNEAFDKQSTFLKDKCSETTTKSFIEDYNKEVNVLNDVAESDSISKVAENDLANNIIENDSTDNFDKNDLTTNNAEVDLTNSDQVMDVINNSQNYDVLHDNQEMDVSNSNKKQDLTNNNAEINIKNNRNEQGSATLNILSNCQDADNKLNFLSDEKINCNDYSAIQELNQVNEKNNLYGAFSSGDKVEQKVDRENLNSNLINKNLFEEKIAEDTSDQIYKSATFDTINTKINADKINVDCENVEKAVDKLKISCDNDSKAEKNLINQLEDKKQQNELLLNLQTNEDDLKQKDNSLNNEIEKSDTFINQDKPTDLLSADEDNIWGDEEIDFLTEIKKEKENIFDSKFMNMNESNLFDSSLLQNDSTTFSFNNLITSESHNIKNSVIENIEDDNDAIKVEVDVVNQNKNNVDTCPETYPTETNAPRPSYLKRNTFYNPVKPNEIKIQKSNDMEVKPIKIYNPNDAKPRYKPVLLVLKDRIFFSFPKTQKRFDTKSNQEVEFVKSTIQTYKTGEETIFKNKHLTAREIEIEKMLNENLPKLTTNIKIENKSELVNTTDNSVFNYFPDHPEYSLTQAMKNNNWLLAFLLSSSDTSFLKRTVNSFLNEFYTEESICYILIILKMTENIQLIDLEKNWKNYFNIALKNRDIPFIEKLVCKISKVSQLNALYCYIVLAKNSIILDVLIFYNNLFAINILEQLNKKCKINDIDILIYNKINIISNFDKEEGMKIFKNSKSFLRKEFVKHFDELFGKKNMFDGWRSVVDMGISKIIGLDYEKNASLCQTESNTNEITNAVSFKKDVVEPDSNNANIDINGVIVNENNSDMPNNTGKEMSWLSKKIFVNKRKEKEYNAKQSDSTDVKPDELNKEENLDGMKNFNSNTEEKENVVDDQPDNLKTKKPDFYQHHRYTQSSADIFAKTEPEETNVTKDDIGLVLKSFLKDDEDIKTEPKKIEVEEQKEKKSFFSRLFGTKKKIPKVNLQSDAAFVYDPNTKTWINKNEKKDTVIKNTFVKKEKVAPQKIDKVEVKKVGLQSRYAGLKRANVSVDTNEKKKQNN